MPHSRPLMTTEMLIDARTPILAMYSRWIGDMLRNTEALRSRGTALCDGAAVTAIGTYEASPIKRSVFFTYMRRACAGISLAG